MAATGIYEWKQPAPKLPGTGIAPEAPADPMAAAKPAQGSMFGTAGAPPAAGSSFGDLLKDGPAGSSPTPSFNDLLGGVGEVRAQNVQGAQQATAQGFSPQAPSAGSQIARNSFIKAQSEAERKVLEQSALSGRDETGQIVGDRRDFLQKQALPARMDFEAQLQAQEEEQAQKRQQQSVQNTLAFEQLGSGERQAEADRLSAERMQGKAIASTEKLGFADLSVREKSLAQEGAQFKDELSFKKYATEGGWSQQEADRAWQSMEGEKERESRASESALSRELQKYLGDRGLDIDEKQLSETIRQFDGKVAFDTWATQAGLDDNEKGRVWEGHLADLDQKWRTGERLGSQEHQSLLEDKRIKADTLAQEFEKSANLEILGKTQEWDAAKMEIANGYQTARDSGQMSHEQAMQQAKLAMEENLTKMGVDAQAARQASEIEARRWEVTRELKQQETIANAELLYKYASLRETTGIQKQELQLKTQEIANQVSQFAQSFGLDQERVMRTLTMEENKERWGTQAMIMEMAGDNPDLVAFASKRMVDNMVATGMVDSKQGETMKYNIDHPPPPSPTNPLDTFSRGVDNIGEGNILTGAGQVVGGAVGAAGDAVGDTVQGIGQAGKAVADWVGSFW